MARNEMSKEEKLSIHSMKSNGVSVREIAKRFKRSSRLINRALKEAAAANGVAPVVMAAAPLEATRNSLQTAQPQQQVPQQQRDEPSVQLLSPLSQETDVEPSFQLLPPLPQDINQPSEQMNAQQRLPPPKQQKTAQKNLSALSPPPQKPSYALLPFHLPNGSYDGRYGSLTDNLSSDSRTMSALPASLPVPVSTTKTSKRATRKRRQAANLQPVQQSSSPQILPKLLQEIPALSSALRQEVAEKSTSSPEPPQPKQFQDVSSPPRNQVHQQMLPRKPASASSEPSDSKYEAPITNCQPASATHAGTSEVVPGIVGANSGGILAIRRPITRPPRVFPFTRPTPTSSAGSVSKDGTNGSVTAGQSTVKSTTASNQRVDRRTTTKGPPESDLMALLMGLGPDEDTSPQTSQEEDPTSSQVDSLSQVSGTSSKHQQWKPTFGASIPGTSQRDRFGAMQTGEPKQSEANQQVKLSQLRVPSKMQLVVDSRGAGASHFQISLPNQNDGGNAVPSGIDGPSKNHFDNNHSLLSSLQDQVENLQQEHIGDDKSNVRQFLSAIQDDLGSLSTDTTDQHSERKRKRAEDAESTIMGKLLHEKMAAEVTLMNLQVQREKAQLHRERMKTEVEAALSRKQLEDANIPKLTIDRIFAQMMAE